MLKKEIFFIVVLYIILFLQWFMNENSRVVVRVEYDRNGITRVWHGEIDEIKLEQMLLIRIEC